MHTKLDLLRDIHTLDLDPKGTLLIHSSCRAIGPVEGGAHTVLDAWCDFYREGLLIFPTHTWDRVGKDHPVFDSRKDPSCVGILSELFRQRPGAVRSLHPTHSVAALGKDARGVHGRGGEGRHPLAQGQLLGQALGPGRHHSLPGLLPAIQHLHPRSGGVEPHPRPDLPMDRKT